MKSEEIKYIDVLSKVVELSNDPQVKDVWVRYGLDKKYLSTEEFLTVIEMHDNEDMIIGDRRRSFLNTAVLISNRGSFKRGCLFSDHKLWKKIPQKNKILGILELKDITEG